MKLPVVLTAFLMTAAAVEGGAVLTGEYRDVSAAEARKIITEEKPVILDVRTPEEFEEGHIPGAVNINVSAPDFAARVEKLDPRKTYVVYCRSGNRGKRARQIMQQKNFRKVYNLTGGIKEWNAAGYPLER